MSNVTQWLANLNTTTVLIVMGVLLVLRFALSAIKNQTAKSLAEIAESLAIAMGLVFLIIRPFFVQAFFIPSESMLSTLRIHDHLLVNKTVYIMRDPRPGEIVVFAAPQAALHGEMLEAQLAKGQDTDYIKRVAGVPGDTIRVVPGYISVNGKNLDRITLRTIYRSYRSTNHVGEYFFWTIDTDRMQDPAGELVDRMIAAFAAGKKPAFGSSGMEIDGVPIEMTPDKSMGVAVGQVGPSVRLADNAVYVDGRKLTEEEWRKPFPKGSSPQIHPGYIVRNGKRWNQPYLGEDAELPYPITAAQASAIASETSDPYIPGQVGTIANAITTAQREKRIELVTDSTGQPAVKLMPGQYLMMGDNRNNSSDGRFWGPIDRWRVKGRPLFKFFPLKRFGWVR